MIKWLCWKMVKWAQEYDAYKRFREDDGQEIAISGSRAVNKVSRLSTADHDVPRTFRFDVCIARGGVIVTTRRYDPKKDETHEIINVIHEDADTSKNIADIVSMEILKS